MAENRNDSIRKAAGRVFQIQVRANRRFGFLLRPVDALKHMRIMNKYKTSIEVKGENIKALFDCPIVTDIKKATDAAGDGLDVTDMLYSVTAVNMAGAHRQVKRGSVLAQDVCGHWEIMTADEWELRKDDTIGDGSSEEL